MSQEAIWLIVAGVCFIGEIFTVSFLLFIPGVAAVLAFILAMFKVSLSAQIIVFVVTTILMILFIRPLMQKLLKTKDTPTNSNALIGKKGIVTKDIEGSSAMGQVKIAGEIWTAQASTDVNIPIGTKVKALEISGVKLIVEKCLEEN